MFRPFLRCFNQNVYCRLFSNDSAFFLEVAKHVSEKSVDKKAEELNKLLDKYKKPDEDDKKTVELDRVLEKSKEFRMEYEESDENQTDYFKNIESFRHVSSPKANMIKLEQDNMNIDKAEDSLESLKNKIQSIDLKDLKSIPKGLSTVAPLVDQNETLRNLLKMGVDIAKMESEKGGSNLLVRLNWERHVVPLMSILKDLAPFDDKQLANIFSCFPKIFRKNLEDVCSTIMFFSDRGISPMDRATIIGKNPRILHCKKESLVKFVKELEYTLQVSQAEMNHIMITCPEFLTRELQNLKDTIVTTRFMIGFSLTELKQMVLKEPKLLITNKTIISTNFIFLHRSLNVDYEELSKIPSALTVKPSLLGHRVKFLIYLNRLQTDSTKELYTPYSNIVLGRDEDFCRDVAHTSIEMYRKFLKTL